MKVYEKLNAARASFHSLKLKKTGLNKFAGYEYFEIGDFIIPALNAFNDAGLCAFISFGKELATMRITAAEDGSFIEITSPMSTCEMKGLHEVQRLGAVQTYLRRYLWVAAMEIVEHDAIDSSPGAEERKPDVSAILKGIANSTTIALLTTNFNHAMSMLDETQHPAIRNAANKRKAELTKKETT